MDKGPDIEIHMLVFLRDYLCLLSMGIKTTKSLYSLVVNTVYDGLGGDGKSTLHAPELTLHIIRHVSSAANCLFTQSFEAGKVITKLRRRTNDDDFIAIVTLLVHPYLTSTIFLSS
jgi:hypothetical protein